MQDLSDSMTYGVLGESSQAAGNTSSVNPDFSPPGSPSEAYSGVPVFGHPEIDLPAQDDFAHFEHSGHDDAFSDRTWDVVQGVNGE